MNTSITNDDTWDRNWQHFGELIQMKKCLKIILSTQMRVSHLICTYSSHISQSYLIWGKSVEYRAYLRIKYMELLKSKKLFRLWNLHWLWQNWPGPSVVWLYQILLKLIFSDNSDHVMLILLPVVIRDVMEISVFDRDQWHFWISLISSECFKILCYL